LRIGIICDVGMTPSTVLRGYLERFDVLRHFDHWSFSDEVGVYKPHPTIFRHALDGLDVTDPTRAAHIGDLRRTDVAGARAMGMLAVRYRGVEDDPVDPDAGPAVEGDHVIDDHNELVSVLLS
jgi:putative hydrolase of the HAD superfamily